MNSTKPSEPVFETTSSSSLPANLAARWVDATEAGALTRSIRQYETELVGHDGSLGEPSGGHWALWDADGDAPIGAVHIEPASLVPGLLASRMFVAPRYRGLGATQLLTYLALREARIRNHPVLFLQTGGEEHRLGEAPSSFQAQGWQLVRDAGEATRSPRLGGSYQTRLAVADVALTCHRVFAHLEGAWRDWAADNLFTDEIERVVRDGCGAFHRAAFFQRTHDGTLTRDQYINSVANNHQFVRWTTRLLGRVVGITHERELRKHFIEHLKGEVDHEILLENDLRHLGADVDYVKNHMAPSPHIRQFMAIQESVAAFHRNPTWFLAVPFSVESASAFLTSDFIDSLKRCIASWDIANPGRACTFLSSHISTDGGEDGHWEATRRILRQSCRTDDDLQQMCAISRAVMNALTSAYDSYGARPAISTIPWD